MIYLTILAVIMMLVMFVNEMKKSRVDNELINTTMSTLQSKQSGLAQKTAMLESGIRSLQQMTYVTR